MAKNRPFVFGTVIFLLTWVSVDILQVTLLYFIKYGVQREAQSDLIMAVIFVTAMIVLPFWEWVSRHWNKRLAYAAGIAFWAVVQIVLITLNPSTGRLFQARRGRILHCLARGSLGLDAPSIQPAAWRNCSLKLYLW